MPSARSISDQAAGLDEVAQVLGGTTEFVEAKDLALADCSLLRRWMNVIHPVHLFRLLGHRDIQVHHDRFLAAAA